MELLNIITDIALIATAGYVTLIAFDIAAGLQQLWQNAGAPTSPVSAVAPVAVEPIADPWDLPMPTPTPAAEAQVAPAPAPIALLPAARLQLVHTIAPFQRRQPQPDWAAMTPEQLRKECTARGIRWRNAHGKSKHLRKAEMVAALSARGAA